MITDVVTSLWAEVGRYHPAPWIYVPAQSRPVPYGCVPYGCVYSATSDPETDAPVMSADEATCCLVVALVNGLVSELQAAREPSVNEQGTVQSNG